ncbi:MAG: LCP family protein [Lachnospiraceae bacterium]|nr:LCP family protein [Lachnospiraceae bacterium]
MNGRKIVGALMAVILVAGAALIGYKLYTGSKDVPVVIEDAQNGTLGVTDSVGTVDQNTGNEYSEKWAEGTVRYKGKAYRYNSQLKIYLFMGIDKMEKALPDPAGNKGGQADAIFLIVEDPSNKDVKIIAVNRNTMTTIEVYDNEGNFVGKEISQICLQHGYGDGTRNSCQRTVTAVSNLFYGIPIDGYLAMNMGGIPQLNEALGGVEVKIAEECTLGDTEYRAGDTVVLDGDMAMDYLHVRDKTVFDSATGRLERQISYIPSMLDKMSQKASDAGELALVYKALEDYIVTNLDFMEYAEELAEYGMSDAEIIRLKGDMTMGEKYEEYKLDETALYEMVLDIFYKEADEP